MRWLSSQVVRFTQIEGRKRQTTLHGWIVDTSIECDHQRFNGFLKVSLEEILIALRDDRRLLHDLTDCTLGVVGVPLLSKEHSSLGFSADNLVNVIESQTVWMETHGQTLAQPRSSA
ncbi:MAG: hypothetical protein IPI14_12710 [Polaromonas sp.]|nr:hypothetical protein [Polaromonas sp.]